MPDTSPYFEFLGKPYNYCDSPYNNSRLNERAIEVPLGLSLLSQYGKDCLEVGAVLPHYASTLHPVIDLHEQGDMITNANILTWYSAKKYKAAISISTLEHVGNGYSDPLLAMQLIKKHLEPNAPYLFTIPCGYNKQLDNLILKGYAPVDSVYQFNKVDIDKHIWRQVELGQDILDYNGQSKWCNSLLILTNID